MSVSNPFTRGRNVKISYRQNSVKVIAAFKSANLEEMADEITDDVNGEQRSRFDLVVNGYKMQLVGYAPDFAQLDSFLVDTANDDIANPPLSKALQMTIALLDGSTRAYRLSGMGSSRSPWKLDVGGRKETVMQSIAYRMPYMSTVNV